MLPAPPIVRTLLCAARPGPARPRPARRGLAPVGPTRAALAPRALALIALAFASLASLGPIGPAADLLAPTAHAQSAGDAPATDPAAAELMRTVHAAFEALESYERTMAMTMNMNMGGQVMAQSMTSMQKVIPPGKHRAELSVQGMTFVTVSDGETTWHYNPMAKQYTETAAATLGGADALGGMAISESQLESTTDGANIIGTDTLTVGDRTIPCTVVQVDPALLPDQEQVTVENVRLWLSASEPFVLKVLTDLSNVPTPMGAVSATVDNVVSSYTVNEPIADEVFDFTPPAGATRVEEFTGPGGAAAGGQPASPLEGKPAPDFTGTTLDGTTVTLSSLRGRVVLVDFWATWCGPCRVELPHVQKIHEESGGDLAILAVSNEKLPTIERFIEKNGYTFTTVHDPTRQISNLYGVRSLPTVVIVDAEGNVASHLIGLRTEAQLRAALADAGLGEE